LPLSPGQFHAPPGQKGPAFDLPNKSEITGVCGEWQDKNILPGADFHREILTSSAGMALALDQTKLSLLTRV